LHGANFYIWKITFYPLIMDYITSESRNGMTGGQAIECFDDKNKKIDCKK